MRFFIALAVVFALLAVALFARFLWLGFNRGWDKAWVWGTATLAAIGGAWYTYVSEPSVISNG